MSAANIFEALRGHIGSGESDDALNFEPTTESRHWVPTMAPPGSHEKKAVLRRRLTLGLPLWHPEDNQIAVPLSYKPRGESSNVGISSSHRVRKQLAE